MLGIDPGSHYATATTAGHVAGMLESTVDCTTDTMAEDDSTGVTTSYTYYLNGQTASVTKSWTDGSGLHTVVESQMVYDALGRVIQSTDANGKATTTSYDANGQVLDTTDIYGGVTHNIYDATGHLVQM